jgi:adenylate kinase family enzyme
MQRIVILGCSGTGKSTLAQELGTRLDLPVIHLDSLFWKPGWVESERPAFRDRVALVAEQERWVMDGNYGVTFPARLPRADLIVLMQRSRLTCLSRAIGRSVRLWGRSRPDLAEGCPERFDIVLWRYIWNYPRDSAPKTEAAIARLAPQTPIVRLTSDAETAAFLAGL